MPNSNFLIAVKLVEYIWVEVNVGRMTFPWMILLATLFKCWVEITNYCNSLLDIEYCLNSF